MKRQTNTSPFLTGSLSLLLTVLSGTQSSAQTEQEIAFARDYLNNLQARSFRNDREYCGFFGYDRTGKLVAVKPRAGDANSCVAYWPRGSIDVVASYHTHGAWDKLSDGEVPSVEDVESDIADEIDGYISTPGGRLWFVDGDKWVAHLVCGRDCLASDPDFRSEPEGSIPDRFSLKALRRRQGG
jgi:hypothetical protein